MEYASYLAGESWSDHPSCTHPLLAHLARLINDYTSDAARPRLVGLVPSVVGLTSDDVRVDLRIAARAASTALPVVAEERQRSMALTVLVADRLLAGLDGRPPARTIPVLGQVPLAARWAREHEAMVPVSLRAFRKRGARAAVLYAVDGIAKACIDDPDGLLRELLTATIDDCAAAAGRAPAEPASAPGVTARA